MLAEFLGTFVLIVFGVGVVAQTVLSKAGRHHTLDQHRLGSGRDDGVLRLGGGDRRAPESGRDTGTRRSSPFPVEQSRALRDRADAWRVCRFGRRLHDLSRSADRLRWRHATGGRHAGDRRHLGHLSAVVSQRFPGGFIDQVVGTALLVAVIFGHQRLRAIAPAADGLTPVVVGLLVVLIGATFGFNSGYAINPARDFGPRLFTSVAGWGLEVFRAEQRLVVGADYRAARRRRRRAGCMTRVSGIVFPTGRVLRRALDSSPVVHRRSHGAGRISRNRIAR